MKPLFEKEDLKAKILSNVEVAPCHFLMKLAVSAVFGQARPGQFVMLRPAGRGFPFLGRPLGIYGLERGGGEVRIEILYRTAGKGTRVISSLCEGDGIEILGPLGNCFELKPGMKTVVFVAGGIGIAPLAFLAEHLCRDASPPGKPKMVLFMGAQCSEGLLGVDRMKSFGAEVRVATDDGSAGHRGFVTELFAKDLPSFDASTEVFVCGPNPMLKRMSEVVEGHPIACQVLMEERMACGMGACLGCTIEVRTPSGIQYRQVCSDGPVFDLRSIVWR